MTRRPLVTQDDVDLLALLLWLPPALVVCGAAAVWKWLRG
jgi:hypothetical protein